MINYGEPSQPKLEKELPFCFVLLWYSLLGHCVCRGHLVNNGMQHGQLVRADAHSIFLRCLWAFLIWYTN